ncbi:hypothetical protein SDC9_140204 [bioreactor metagenome]|uniref:Uncharacterized protein n=1 Tax=bioreactor metagenome TaxID=1076179 RepID=A0A645DVA7_9ZZZZ
MRDTALFIPVLIDITFEQREVTGSLEDIVFRRQYLGGLILLYK